MIGLNNNTGQIIADDAHLSQSIKDILTTPIGSRVMREQYGSYLFRLIDSATNETGRMRVIAAIADCLQRWEPRLVIEQISLESQEAGQLIANLQYQSNNQLNQVAVML